MKQKPIYIGIIGHGNIGRGVVDYFKKGNGKKFNVFLKKVVVSNIDKHKKSGLGSIITDKVEEIFNDPEINIVVELMGGLKPAKEYIAKAIGKGKGVVTANKAVMALNVGELFDLASKNGVDLAFEAAVGGGIPIINTLSRYKGEKIKKVMGVLNGTTNFILTKMEEGLDFDSAVKIAQAKGFAEANHILDTGGFDTRDKLSLISSLVFDCQVEPEKISTRGITDITPIDIDFADKYGVSEGGRGYVIKLLGVAERINGSVELRVNPALIPRDHPLASVRNEVNAVYLEGSLAGPQTFSGRGAGTNPTTSAVVSDILRIASNIQKGVIDTLPSLSTKIDYLPSEKSEQAGYIRVNLLHKPGSIHEITGIIAKHGLNIKDSVQREKHGYKLKDGTMVIPYIITVEPAPQKVIDDALAGLAESGRVDGEPLFMSIED